MSEHIGTSDWTAHRGAKWTASLRGMEAMLRPVDEPLLDAARLDAPARVADLGCGGGGTTLVVRRRAPVGSVICGVDSSPSLITAARERLPPDERAITFEVADLATAAPEQRYHRLVSRFGVMFFDDPLAAFTNLRDWLEPGGSFAFAVWGAVADNPWLAIPREEVARVVELPSASPDAPGPFRYARSEGMLTALDRAGFVGLEAREWRGLLPLGRGLGAAGAARCALSSFSDLREVCTGAGGPAHREAHRALTERLSRHQHEGAVRLGACVRIVTGARPHG